MKNAAELTEEIKKLREEVKKLRETLPVVGVSPPVRLVPYPVPQPMWPNWPIYPSPIWITNTGGATSCTYTAITNTSGYDDPPGVLARTQC